MSDAIRLREDVALGWQMPSDNPHQVPFRDMEAKVYAFPGFRAVSVTVNAGLGQNRRRVGSRRTESRPLAADRSRSHRQGMQPNHREAQPRRCTGPA
jgi:hypothetical protein